MHVVLGVDVCGPLHWATVRRHKIVVESTHNGKPLARSSRRSSSVVAAAAVAMQALADQGIHADRDGLHVMNPEVLNSATSMQEECKEFLSKTKQFNDIVGDFVEVMEGKSKVIETEKLRAIGLANRVDHEKEVRKRRQVCDCRLLRTKKHTTPCVSLRAAALLTWWRVRACACVQLELQAMINEKKAELERLNLQHESLQRVEADQKALIEKLTNNEA